MIALHFNARRRIPGGVCPQTPLGGPRVRGFLCVRRIQWGSATVFAKKVIEQRLECGHGKGEESASNLAVLNGQERAVDPRLVRVILPFDNKINANDRDSNDAVITRRRSARVQWERARQDTYRVPGSSRSDNLNFFIILAFCSRVISVAGILNSSTSQTRLNPEFVTYTVPHARHVYLALSSTCHAYGQ